MKRIRPISGTFSILVIAVAGLLLVSMAGCDYHRYSVRARGSNYHTTRPVRYASYHTPARPIYTQPNVVIVSSRDNDRRVVRTGRDKDRRDRHDRDRDDDKDRRPRRRRRR